MFYPEGVTMDEGNNSMRSQTPGWPYTKSYGTETETGYDVLVLGAASPGAGLPYGLLF
jgi:hypothetical protein